MRITSRGYILIDDGANGDIILMASQCQKYLYE